MTSKYTSTGRRSGEVRELPNRPSAMLMHQRIIRIWSKHLDVYDLAVLQQLVDRTLGWGKTKVSFSLARIINGDDCWAPMNISRRKLFYSLKKLEGIGMIVRQPHPGKEINFYSVNVGWTEKLLETHDDATNASDASGQCTPCTATVHQMHTRERIGEKEEREKEDYSGAASPCPVPSAISIVREQIDAASAASRSTHIVKRQTLPNQIAGIEAAWRMALEETFPQADMVAWSVREKAQIKGKVKTWIAKDGLFIDAADWAVRNWAAIIAKQFRWMTKSPPPKIPEVGFFLSFMSQFLECRSERKLDKWLAAPERTEFEKLTARGLSSDEAFAEIGMRRAVEGMREENEKVRIEARARHRRAEIVEKRTEVMANLPAHPDSPAARRARAAELPAPATMTEEELKNIDWANMPVLDPNWEPPL